MLSFGETSPLRHPTALQTHRMYCVQLVSGMQAVREMQGKLISQHLQVLMDMPSLPMAMPSLARAKETTYFPQIPPFLTPTIPSLTLMDSHQPMAQRQLSEQMLMKKVFPWPYKLFFARR